MLLQNNNDENLFTIKEALLLTGGDILSIRRDIKADILYIQIIIENKINVYKCFLIMLHTPSK